MEQAKNNIPKTSKQYKVPESVKLQNNNQEIRVDCSNPELYTEVFWKIQDAKKRFLVNYGGAGSSKSVSQHQNETINILDADYDILFIRKHASDIRDSCYKLLKEIAQEWGIYEMFHWRYSSSVREIENKYTGHKIMFRGIDDPEKVKSIVGVKRIIVEEASELNFEDHLELNRRARGIEDIQIVYILNPISENHWIKKKLIDGEAYAGRVDVIKSTYKDNRFLTADDILELEALKDIDENQYNIYVLALWGIDDKQSKFAYAFERKQHVCEDMDWNPDEYVYLSFDFNVNPICCLVTQDYDDAVDGIELIKLSDSDIYRLCDYIKAGYPEAMFIVTGDASGRNRSAMVKDELDYFKIIKQELELLDSQFKVPKSNPKLESNRILVNAFLKNVPFQIGENKCKALIEDCLYCEVDKNNKLIKDRKSKKAEADALDCLRYYVNTFHRHILSNKYLKD